MFNLISLGQSGFKIELNNQVIFIDPYLSNSIEYLYGEGFKRLLPIYLDPSLITDANWVLISHIHEDHCDLDTVIPLSKASPYSKFVGPAEVVRLLHSEGIESDRLFIASDQMLELFPGIKLYPIPAAHPRQELDQSGSIRFVGYILQFGDFKLYHSGDTSVSSFLIDDLKRFMPIDIAMIPVNEPNFFKENCNIVGNMTIREAFLLAEIIGVKQFIPIHWDMFTINQVFKEEIELLYDKLKPNFKLFFNPYLF